MSAAQQRQGQPSSAPQVAPTTTNSQATAPAAVAPRPTTAPSTLAPTRGVAGNNSAGTSVHSQKQFIQSRLQTVSLTHRKPTAPVGGAAAEGETTATPVAPAEKQHEVFTLEQLRYYWLRFANELPPQQGAESGRLKMIQPQLKENCLVEAMVDNAAAAEYLRKVGTSLAQYLRRALRNDDIIVNFVVNTAVNTKPRAFSPREIYQEMLGKNDAFKQLAETLHLVVY